MTTKYCPTCAEEARKANADCMLFGTDVLVESACGGDGQHICCRHVPLNEIREALRGVVVPAE